MFHTLTLSQIQNWNGILWLGLATVWLASAPFAKKTIYRQGYETRLWQTLVVALGLYLLFGAPTGVAWLDYRLIAVGVPLGLAGLATTLCGLAFSVWARLILGGNWSGNITLKQDHTLVRSGPYSFVRHPIYTGLLLALLGSALERGLVRSLLALPICAFGLWLKVTAEEELMLQRFGDEYRRYKHEVRVLVPFLF